MSTSGILLLIVMISFSISALMVWYWAKKDGQFNNVEEAKYAMLNDEEEFDEIKRNFQKS
ncbi:cbb3-type cytochrome oxidase assembly protein [Brevibacillus sp. SYSU BS000544]|uniref:cbb3-type cytochrome oxidase assembly protein n=1 Tax=Brevibacillus sp. SYSU BS000544 TaxID=3416443 RepID=UPI003CE48294